MDTQEPKRHGSELSPPRRRIVLLGTTTVTVDDRVVHLRQREQEVLAALAIRRNRALDAEALCNTLWVIPPASATKTVQNYISRIRRNLGEDAIETEGRTYALGTAWASDLDEFESYRAQAELSRRIGDHEAQRAQLGLALALVRGEPLGAFEATPLISLERTRLNDAIAMTQELFLVATIESGRLREAIILAGELVGSSPDRERLWRLHAVALARSGERRLALETLQVGRRHLRDRSGISAGQAVNRLESLILADDPALITAAVDDLIDAEASTGTESNVGDQFFIGRTQELAILHELRTSTVRDQKPAIIHFTGGPGTGRSMFGRRACLLASADGWLALQGRCRSGAVRPLEPFGDLAADAMQKAVQRRRAPATKHADVLATIQDRAFDRKGAASLSNEVVDLFANLAVEQPLLLVIDDSDLLQPTSAQIILRLCSLRIPCVVVLIGKGPFLPEVTPTVPVVELQAFSANECRQLFRVLSGETLSSEDCEQLLLATRGNPSLVREVAIDAASWDLASLDVGDPVARAAMATIMRLEHHIASACLALSLTSTPVERHLLARTLSNVGVADPHGAILEGIALGVILTSGYDHVQVASEALHAAVRLSAPEDRIAEMHDAWWDTFEEFGPDPMRAVIHADASSARYPQRAVEALDLASTVAANHGMFVEAAGYQQQVICILSKGCEELLKGDPTAARISSEILRRRTQRCDVLRRGGDSAGIVELWNIIETARQADDVSSVIRALGVLCSIGERRLTWREGQNDHDISVLLDHYLPRCDDLEIRARAAAQASQLYSLVDRARGQRHYLAALDDARRTNSNDTVAFVLGYAHGALSHPNDWPLRHLHALELLRLGEVLNDNVHRFAALHLLFSTQMQSGNPLIRTTLSGMARLAESVATSEHRSLYLGVCAAQFHIDGRFDESKVLCEQTAHSATAGSPNRAVEHLLQLFVLESSGHPREANGIDAELGQVSTILPGLSVLPAIAAWRSVSRGDFHVVRDLLDSTDCGEQLAVDAVWLGAMYLLARSAAALGDRTSSLRFQTVLTPYTHLMSWAGQCTFGPIDLALAELACTVGDLAAAGEHLRRAEEICTSLYTPSFTAELQLFRQRLDQLSHS
jgi:DNA-binding SARP family transcriptional activator